MKTAILFFLCAQICSVSAEGDAAWGYEAPALVPSEWSTAYPQCGEPNQSPVNIDPMTTVYKGHLGKINLAGFGDEPESWELHNNGHLVKMYPKSHQMSISGGGLPSTYDMSQTHFHWGKTNDEGSEHVINNKGYPLVMHIVTRNNAANLSLDLEYDHYAVMAVFFEVSDTPDAAASEVLTQIQDSFINVTYKEDRFVLPDSFLVEKLMPADKDHFYRYNGSLTTPGCHEAVIWTVFVNTVKITAEQVAKFRTLATTAADADKKLMTTNFRPVQPLGSRTIWRSFQQPPVNPTQTTTPSGGAPPLYSPMVIFSIFLALVYFC